MRIKLDENIPRTVRGRLASAGLDVDTVLDEGLGGRPDDDVWAAAQADGRFLLSGPDLATWAGCFVVATPTKVRVLRPPV